MRTLLPLLAIALCLTTACKRPDTEVPKRYAYPRVEAYDSTTVEARIAGIGMEINAAADTVMPRREWLDISYPRYGATIHLSVNKYSDSEAFAEALRNRSQRISLNFGDARAKAETFTNTSGFDCEIVSSPEAGSAPILFVASKCDGTIVNGSAVFSGSTLPVDSIFPIFTALYSDITRLLLSLK